jgi:CheY-like chemotaxis protein
MAPQTPVAILIIDDDPGVVRALASLLRRDGYTVDTAENGHHALTQLQERPYDVLLCDLHMPALDGPDFYAILLRQYTYLHQRVIFLTGDSLRLESTAFLEQCGERWLYKPCSAEAIRNAIQQVLAAVQPLHAMLVCG